MAKVLPYYAPGSLSAAYYDRITAADPTLVGDEQAYAGLAPPEGSILELGAGSGRLTAALAARGHDVLGVDISPVMLAQGHARLAALAPGIRARARLVRGDMTALDLKRTFDLVICPFFTLAHVPGGAAWRNTFATAARHLGHGGLAAFHLPKSGIMRLPGPPDASRPVLQLAIEDGRRLLLFVRERSFREDIGRLDQVIEYAIADAAGRVVRRSAERLTYWWTDPEPPAAAAGLTRDRDPIELGGVGEIRVFRKA
ncbi:MAG: class I SAM-dependent methyltransferase [Phenylobacterium sp.]|uniref:class I SAM-dependent methyltransferase n=1 Tax=Phenylobacterium sp. TaxID=1871053 RepID=UPI001A3A6355|nr:class I SAM-dependent methyltransferase [Phenylobacterium sp.]MBL8554746.1 class I SAM-dependent methyltransferase [Phenylobacterium sp.]